MKQRVKANIRFKDKEIGAWRAQGDVWEVDANRGWQLTQTKHNNFSFVIMLNYHGMMKKVQEFYYIIMIYIK